MHDVNVATFEHRAREIRNSRVSGGRYSRLRSTLISRTWTSARTSYSRDQKLTTKWRCPKFESATRNCYSREIANVFDLNKNKFQNDKSISATIRSGVLLSAEKNERPPVARHLKCPFLTHAEAPVVAPALADDQVWVRPKTLLEDYELKASLLKKKAWLRRHECLRITQ